MEWIVISAKTVDEAREQAMDRLGVDESDLEFEVLEAPRTGFLGMGRVDAQIRARVKPVSREKPTDRRRERRRGRSRGGERARDAKQDDQRQPARNDDRSEGSARGERSRHRGGGGTTTRTKQEQGVNHDSDSHAEPTEDELEEQRAAAVEFIGGLLDVFDLDADVNGAVRDDHVDVSVEGTGLGILIGPGGVTLSAIEEVTHSVVQRSTGGHSTRVRVDVAGYRERRRAALEGFTREVAGRVLESGEPQALEPMGSADRKVVHDTVADLEGLETTSEGMEPRRRVVIRRS
jgi:spoIIIJ-associated protein